MHSQDQSVPTPPTLTCLCSLRAHHKRCKRTQESPGESKSKRFENDLSFECPCQLIQKSISRRKKSHWFMVLAQMCDQSYSTNSYADTELTTEKSCLGEKPNLIKLNRDINDHSYCGEIGFIDLVQLSTKKQPSVQVGKSELSCYSILTEMSTIQQSVMIHPKKQSIPTLREKNSVSTNCL